MTHKTVTRIVTVVLCIAMIMSVVPVSALASIPGWADNNVVYDGDTFGTNGYYNVISKKDYVLVPGAAVESEIVLNNASGTRRQVLHVIEVDPSNPDVSIVPGYYQIDKDLENEANWSHKELTEMAKYYEDTLGYNIVGGMNTDLYYNSYSPRVLVYNGKWIGNAHENVATGGTVLNATSSILYVFKDAEGNVSCDVKAYNKADVDKYLADGTLLHAVGVSFGMVVKDGALVNTTEKRGNDDAARSMVGVKADGTLVICMNDGRGANNSVGFSSYEEGEAMLALGCMWAANCDGGGSSTFLTKRVGEETFTMRSVPCDGAQRPTAHGIFVASNVAPTGILNNVNVESDYDIFAPGTVYNFGAEAIDTHGYAMDMPADASWALSDTSFGTISNGKFTSNGKGGTVDVQVISGGKVVGSKTIIVANPETFKLSATSTVVPYTTAEKVRTITLPIVAMTGEANVYVDTNVVSVSLSNTAAGTLDGFNFTSTSDESIAGVNVTIKYGDITLTYAIEFGKGSEIIWDFEDGDKAGFMGFEEAKKWSQENGVNNSLVLGSKDIFPGQTSEGPLAGQFNEYLSSTTFISSVTNGGEVRNGNNALAWRLDNTDAAFASWSYNIIFNTNDRVVFRDVENGLKATTLGMWVYIPEGAPGLAFQSQLYGTKDGKTWGCYQDHFMFTSAATGKQTNLNSATEADIPESRWVYMSINISGYLYLSTMDPNETASNVRSPSFIRTYVKPTVPAELTFYIDDITLDYSSAVDDRVLPTITAPTYSTADTALSLENGKEYAGTNFAFSATVADNAALDFTSGKIFVDGVEVQATIAGNALSTKGDVVLVAGTHTVAFEVKDELGNPAKLTRTFTVSGDAVVELGGHNDSAEAPMAQSVYYVDINVADLANVTKLVATLKLNNANTWETEGAVVANGFKVAFDYNEISELLTVTVEADGTAKATEGAIVSIPVRVWTWDRYNFVTEEYVAVTGNMPVVNIVCDVVSGVVDGASFGGSINVATVLTTISSPYHVHDDELTVLNKEATTSAAGYENRTYCETCKSVVEWGTIIPKIEITHNYEIVDGKFVCTDEDCGEVYASGTGVFEMNGDLYYSINNVLKTGWQDADGGYCYASTSSYKLYRGEATIGKIKYTFDENGVTKGAWVVNATGTRYSYGPGYYTRAWAEIDGYDYYFGRDSYMYTGIRFIKANPDTDPVWYDFGESGATDKAVHPADGLYWVNGDLYYCKNGVSQFGLQYVDGDYYFFRIGSGFDRVGFATRNESYYVNNTNGLKWADGTAVAKAWYEFDADGKMVVKEGLVDGYYYENNKVVTYKGLIEVDGNYYYIADHGKAVTSKVHYVLTTNGLTYSNGVAIAKGNYEFDADGKMIIKEGFVDGYYYENNKVVTYKGLIEVDGNYYYIADHGKAVTSKVHYVLTTNGLTYSNGVAIAKGNYEFDADGKMIIKHGADADGYFYLNGVKQKAYQLVEFEGHYYFISDYHKYVAGRKTYVSAARLEGTGLKAGYYEFDETGKMIIE